MRYFTSVINTKIHFHQQDCSKKEPESSMTWKVSQLGREVNVSNENGLCISVSTNAENCGDRGQSQPVHIILPPPPGTRHHSQLPDGKPFYVLF